MACTVNRVRKRMAFGILAACALLSLFACAESGGGPASDRIDPEAEYIVRLKGEVNAPFRVMRGDALTGLLGSDELLWYEEDRPLVLFDGGEEGGSVYYADVQWNLDMVSAEEAFDSG